ncbi:hypothetical protein KSP39_PZI007148 [Platanthera zijinensis]|uniref:Uncharacterized protein n=1 Tax=Platanthera zijinensis TaxID=2320716 RepID=A0AAP0G9I8_9ASPA
MIETPTILFCPRLHYWLIGNIFKSNFCAFCLNQIIFVSIDTKEQHMMDLVSEKLRYPWIIERYIRKEVRMDILPPSSSTLITGWKFHFYHVEDDCFKRFPA